MAKLLKTKKHKVAPKKAAKCAPKKIVLVGTYKEDQLIKWPQYYNYPLLKVDLLDADVCRDVNELWLFKGPKKGVYCRVEFVDQVSREELIHDYGYPAKGSGHSRDEYSGQYLLFRRLGDLLEKPSPHAEIDKVHVRARDFARRTPAMAKQLKTFLESGSRKNPTLAKLVPPELLEVPPSKLCVRESVQSTFFNELMKSKDDMKVLKNSARPIAIDLFAGCGGLSLGFEQAGFDIAAALEIDPIHAAAHEYNFPYAKTICADIKNVSGADIRRDAGIGGRDVDIVFGGAPCQGFSMIGKRALDDPRNQLIGHYLRIVSDIRPKYCVLENVKGLTVGKHAQFLAELIDELKKIKYTVLLPYKVLNAANYGVPQNRERLFLIAAREDQKLPEYPEPLEAKVTVEEAIKDLPDADKYKQLLEDDSVAARWQTKFEYARQLRGLTPDENNFGYDRAFVQDRLTASWRTIHGQVSQDRFLAAPQGETEPHSRFFKLAWTGQSNTLRAGTDSARGGFTSPRPIHPVLPRVITVREAARIHSYPDWFRFNKTKWHGFREIGNSVPPRLARAVGLQIMKAMGVKPKKPSQVLKTGDESLLGFDMRSAADYFGVSRNVIAQRIRKIDEKHD